MFFIYTIKADNIYNASCLATFMLFKKEADVTHIQKELLDVTSLRLTALSFNLLNSL